MRDLRHGGRSAARRMDYWLFGPVLGQLVKIHGTRDEAMEAQSLQLDTASLASHLTVFRVALENVPDY